MPVAATSVVVASSRLAERAEHVAADVGDPRRGVAQLLELGHRLPLLAPRRRSAAHRSRCRSH